MTQRPSVGTAGELMVGGGVIQSPGHGIDEFGIWRDDGVSYTIRAYLEGLMPSIFETDNWGEDSRGSRVKRAWSGCMGFTSNMLPYVGRLDEKLTGRKVPRGSSVLGLKGTGWFWRGCLGLRWD